MDPSRELEQIRRVDLRSWAMTVLQLEPNSSPNTLRGDAVECALGMANQAYRPPELQEIDALHFLIHDQQPMEFFLPDQFGQTDSVFSAMTLPESIATLSNDRRSSQDDFGVIKAAIELFTEAPPSKRLEIVSWAKQYLDKLPTKDSQKTLRALTNEYESVPIVAQFLVYLSKHVDEVRPLSKSCIDEALDNKMPPTAEESSEPFSTGSRLLIVVLIVIGGMIGFLNQAFRAPARNNQQNQGATVPKPAIPGYDPTGVADQIRWSFWAAINGSPFDVSAESILPRDRLFVLMRRESGEHSVKSIVNAMYLARRYRWLYREQHMIRSYLAEQIMSLDGEDIQLDDNGQWRVKNSAAAEEIFNFFLKPAKRWSDKVREIRDQNDLLNEAFWNSTVIELTPREVAIVLEGDPAKTLELDRKLYPDPVEFDLVRRLREQNEPLERSLEQAYGHHRQQTLQYSVVD
jgi:hypothetical protein